MKLWFCLFLFVGTVGGFLQVDHDEMVRLISAYCHLVKPEPFHRRFDLANSCFLRVGIFDKRVCVYKATDNENGIESTCRTIKEIRRFAKRFCPLPTPTTTTTTTSTEETVVFEETLKNVTATNETLSNVNTVEKISFESSVKIEEKFSAKNTSQVEEANDKKKEIVSLVSVQSKLNSSKILIETTTTTKKSTTEEVLVSSTEAAEVSVQSTTTEESTPTLTTKEVSVSPTEEEVSVSPTTKEKVSVLSTPNIEEVLVSPTTPEESASSKKDVSVSVSPTTPEESASSTKDVSVSVSPTTPEESATTTTTKEKVSVLSTTPEESAPTTAANVISTEIDRSDQGLEDDYEYEEEEDDGFTYDCFAQIYSSESVLSVADPIRAKREFDNKVEAKSAKLESKLAQDSFKSKNYAFWSNKMLKESLETRQENKQLLSLVGQLLEKNTEIEKSLNSFMINQSCSETRIRGFFMTDLGPLIVNLFSYQENRTDISFGTWFWEQTPLAGTVSTVLWFFKYFDDRFGSALARKHNQTVHPMFKFFCVCLLVGIQILCFPRPKKPLICKNCGSEVEDDRHKKKKQTKVEEGQDGNGDNLTGGNGNGSGQDNGNGSNLTTTLRNSFLNLLVARNQSNTTDTTGTSFENILMNTLAPPSSQQQQHQQQQHRQPLNEIVVHPPKVLSGATGNANDTVTFPLTTTTTTTTNQTTLPQTVSATTTTTSSLPATTTTATVHNNKPQVPTRTTSQTRNNNNNNNNYNNSNRSRKKR